MGTGRWRQIAESLRVQIEEGSWRPGDRLPSEAELAQRWGVSRMTVQRAMHELQRLGLVHRRRRAGTVVTSPSVRRRAGCVALLAHHSQDRLEMAYLRGIHMGLQEELHLIVCDTQGDPEREAHYLRRMAKETDGIILFPTCDPENTPLLLRLVEARTPLVCIDRYPEGVPVDAFVTDNYQSTLEALRYVISQGGHPLAHLSHPDLYISTVRERYQAYLDAMQEAGSTPPERWVRWIPGVPPYYEPYLASIVADTLIALRCDTPSLRGVFCVNDRYLIATLEACERLNLSAPEDLQILSFQDSISLLPRMAQRIHRLVQQPLELGRRAAERLRSLLEGHVSEPAVVRVPAQFYPAVSDATSVEGG